MLILLVHFFIVINNLDWVVFTKKKTKPAKKYTEPTTVAKTLDLWSSQLRSLQKSLLMAPRTANCQGMINASDKAPEMMRNLHTTRAWKLKLEMRPDDWYGTHSYFTVTRVPVGMVLLYSICGALFGGYREHRVSSHVVMQTLM